MITRVVSFEELPDWVDRNNLSNNGGGKLYASYLLVEYPSGEHFVFSDAMEPEDTTFSRDLDWIAAEIERAWKMAGGAKNE